jgi:hypothetical protein
VGRAFSLGWSIFRFRWRTLLAAAFLPLIPAYGLQVLAAVYLTGSMTSWSNALQEALLRAVEEGRQIVPSDLPPFPLEAIALSFGSGVIVGLASLLASAAVVYIIGWTYGGGQASLGAAFGQVARRALSLIGATLVIAVVLLLIASAGIALMVALVVALGFEPGLVGLVVLIAVVGTFAAVIFVGLRWSFSVQSIMLEGQGALGALGRSWRLVSGSTWRVLGYLLLLAVLLFVIGLIAAIPVAILFGVGVDIRTGQPLPFDAVRVAGQSIMPAVLATLAVPFYLAVMTLLYYDLRWRSGEPLTPPPA